MGKKVANIKWKLGLCGDKGIMFCSGALKSWQYHVDIEVPHTMTIGPYIRLKGAGFGPTP